MGDQKMQTAWRATGQIILGSITLLFLVAGFGSWLFFAELSGAVVTTARLSEDQESLAIQHLEGGLVTRVYVKEGDPVSRGTPLVQLDNSSAISEMTILTSRLNEVKARKSRLLAERDATTGISFPPDLLTLAAANQNVLEIVDGQRRLFGAQQASVAQENAAIGNRSAQIRTQIEGWNAQLDALEVQTSLLAEQLGNQNLLLGKGLTKTKVVLSLRQELAVTQGKTGSFVAKRAEAYERIAELEIEILRAKSRRREQAITQLRDLDLRLAELTQKRQVLQNRLDHLLIRAPANGVVLGLGGISQNSVITLSDILMRIVPQNRRYVIFARISPMNIDQIYVGQPVRISFPTLQTDSIHAQFGQVSQISADLLADDTTRGPYFKVQIKISPDSTDVLTSRGEIVPGIPVEIYIQTQKQPAWAYLAKPFTRYFSHAFRES